MYAQRLDLKDDTEVGKGTCAVNIFQLYEWYGVQRNYKSYLYVHVDKQRDGETVTLWLWEFALQKCQWESERALVLF